MSSSDNPKQRLPYPYDQDLSNILRHLDRRTPSGRARLANDPVTAAYLAAAVRLIEKHLGPNATRIPADPRDDNSIDRPLFKFLSQREVVAEVARNPDPFPRRGSVPTLRSTWRSQSDFIADVLTFALWPEHYPQQHNDVVADNAKNLFEGPEFVEAVHELAYYAMSTVLRTPSFRLSLVAMAEAEGDKVIRDAIADTYRGPLEFWMQAYEAILAARSLRLRSGLTIEEIADIFAAMVDGMTMRAIGDPDAKMIDHEKRQALLGKAILAMMAGCIEQDDNAINMTVEDIIRDLIYGRRGS